MSQMVVRVNRSGFCFTCPACGLPIEETDPVFSLPLSIGLWPVCEACGMDWCAEHGIRVTGGMTDG